MIYKKIDYGTPEYDQTVALRFEILRKPLGLVFTPQDLERDTRDFHFAAIEKDQVAGCLILSALSSERVKMRQVAVDARFQGQGLGKKLVQLSETWAKENHFTELELNARETAVRFYLSQDYKISGDEFIEIGIPHRKMEKQL